MLCRGVLKLLLLVSLLATGQSTYDCETYDKRPGRCISVGHCRDLCPGTDLSFLRHSMALPFDDPACAQPGIMSNAKQVCCPKLICPHKVPILSILNIQDVNEAENEIRTRRSDDAQDDDGLYASDTNDTKQTIDNNSSDSYMPLFDRAHEDSRHHTTYIKHTVYHETRMTVVQTSTHTHLHTYDIPTLTSIVATVEFFTTLPVTHVTRSTITALPILPTLTTTVTNLIHGYKDLFTTKSFTTTIFGHTIDKTSTFTPICEIDINLKDSRLLSTTTHTVEETITSTRTNLRTYVTSHQLFLTSYRSTTYITTVTQTRVIMPTQVIYITITANVGDLTKTAYTTTVNVKETLIIPSTLPAGTHTLTETVYSAVTVQYHTVTATECSTISDTTDTESMEITTQPSLESTTEDIIPTTVFEELVTEDLSTIEMPETTTEMPSGGVTEMLMTTNTTTPSTLTAESTTMINDIERGTRTKSNVFCAIPSKKEKFAKLKVISCGMDQKNVICRKKDRMKLPENSVVLVTCFGSFTQRGKCGHDSKWRPYQINFNNNFTESFTLCNIPDKH